MGYTENINSILKWGNSFQRQFDFPLDRSSLHSSYNDAVAYAKGDGSDSRGLGGQAYIGQTITVWGLNEKGKEGVWVYSLVPAPEGAGYLADLKPVGSATTETAQNYSAAKTLSEGLTVGQLILVSESEDIEETVNDATVTNTYQAGFYIVNAPGSISALGTTSGADDEIGALESRVSALESNKVSNDAFTTYQETVETALAGKVDNSYKEEVTAALAEKVDNSYKQEVSTALDAKVDDEEFTTYQGTVETALAGKVDDSEFLEYQTTVSTALDSKANADALSTLEGRVNTDIQNLTNLVSDYSGTLGDIDDRLVELEKFEETHASIGESDIIGLFTPNTEA